MPHPEARSFAQIESTAPRVLRRTALSAAAIAALLLAGCASSGGTDDETSGEGAALSGSLSIAAAASLEPAFRELADRFTDEHPEVTIENLSFDGSSTLAEQINGGAPYDVFASADENNMEKVAAEGLLDGAAQPFATSSLEIAVAPDNPLGIETLADLVEPGADGEVPIVVICAPEVPCGTASHQLLDRDDVALEPASEEQNMTAVLQKVTGDEADAGLVYRSDVLRSEGKAMGIEIPGSIEAAGTYMIAPLLDAQSSEAARAFVEFTRSDEALALYEELSFGPA